jgi:mersacidin/lichenicidin family type 2 lantibiotic
MSPDQIVRAWKDADYGEYLGAAAAQVPAHPVGPLDIADSALDLAGASQELRTEYVETLGCCQGFTQYTMCDFTAGPLGPYCTTFCITIVLTNSSICGSK